jgi:hypothetical protein
MKLGLALMRDSRIPILSKLLSLAAGAGIVAGLVALEVPVELLLGALLPMAALPLDLMVDGLETVVGPLVAATLLLPHFAPRETVDQIRAERAGLPAGPVIDATFTDTQPAPRRTGVNRLLRGLAR